MSVGDLKASPALTDSAVSRADLGRVLVASTGAPGAITVFIYHGWGSRIRASFQCNSRPHRCAGLLVVRRCLRKGAVGGGLCNGRCP